MSNKLPDFDKSKIAEALAGATSLTKDFVSDEIDKLVGIVEVEKFSADELMLKEDEISRDLMVICEGGVSVEVQLTPGDDSAIQIQKIREGNVIGEFSFIDGSRRSANVRATTETTIIRLPYEALDGLCNSNLQVGFKLMRNLAFLMSQRLRNTNFELRAHLYL